MRKVLTALTGSTSVKIVVFVLVTHGTEEGIVIQIILVLVLVL